MLFPLIKHLVLAIIVQVKIQQFRAGTSRCADNRKSLFVEAMTLSGQLDADVQATDGIPEDRVTRVIFKSARSKVERLIPLVEQEPNTALR